MIIRKLTTLARLQLKKEHSPSDSRITTNAGRLHRAKTAELPQCVTSHYFSIHNRLTTLMLVSVILWFAPYHVAAANTEFITVWQTTADNESITIPTHSESTYNYTVDWGDSNTNVGQTGDATHSYAIAGTHRVSITGDFPRIYFNDAGDNEKIISIEQWGNIAWSSMEEAFAGCANLRYNAADTPDLSSVTSTAEMFRNADIFNGDIGLWDVSQVTDMAGMFDSAASFNQNLNGWDVSQVTNMRNMFLFAVEFNGDISQWNVGQVTDMSGMFVEAAVFNSDISQWDVSQVTDMSDMFLFAVEFNSDISLWKVGQVTDMSGMFDSAESFNQNLSLWDVGQVTNMSNMFYEATEFNGDISQWDVSQVTNMNGMFVTAFSFNQNIGNWDIGQVTDMGLMFFDVTLSTETYDALLNGWSTIDDDESSLRSTVNFHAGNSQFCNTKAKGALVNTPNDWTITDGGQADNCPRDTEAFITTWRTTTDNESITIPTHSGSIYNYNVDWGDSNISFRQTGDVTYSYAIAGTHRVSITGDFPRIYFNGTGDNEKIISIEQWGNIAWSSMENAFEGCVNLRYNAIDTPDFSSVTSTAGMFREADVFNGNIGLWDVSTVTNMAGMFDSATSFNQNLNSWDVSQVTDMSEMFLFAAEFNGDISGWKVGQVTDMSGMFLDATQFNGDISRWDVSQVTDMSEMFLFATEFNSDISEWEVGQVTDMSNMFESAESFNQNLSLWDVSAVTDMSEMFLFATEFNSDISRWEVGQVTDMNNMFNTATSFNQGIGNWNVSQVTDMRSMFSDVTLSTENYDALLSGWSTIDDDESSLRFSVSFHAGNSQYCNQAARNILTGTYSWMITDGNRDTDDNCLIPELANGIADQDTFANTEFGYTFSEDTFNSPSNSSLTYIVNKSPPAEWLNFNAETRTFSGTPSADDIGMITITVTATDSNGNSASGTFTITVPNRPPVVMAGLTPQTATVGNLFEYRIPDGTFSDPDGGRLIYQTEGQPEWLSFSTINNTFSGTPNNREDIGISTVTITATDQFNSSASGTFTITVPNRPPTVMAGFTPQMATLDELFEYLIPDGMFSDPDGGPLSYTATGQPGWLNFSTRTRIFSGTPGSTNDIGISTITVTVTDLNGGNLVSTFTVTVPNQPPVVAAGLVNQSAVINTAFSYSIDGTFSDPDRGTLSYTATGQPGWLNFSTINNTFSGTPTNTNDIGISTITVTVADHLGAISTDNFTLTVVQVNMPTTLTMALENRTAYAGELFMYDIEGFFSDPDGGPLSYTATGQPDWLNFSTRTRIFSGTPTSREDIGISTVTITATDQFNSSASGTFTITVPNRPPVVAAGLTSQTATVGNLFEYPIPDGAFSDPDGGPLSYQTEGQPGWLNFSTRTRIFSGTPGSTNDIGVSTITVTATDLNGGILVSIFTVTVSNSFITIWRTTADNESITIPTHSGSIYNYNVDWGDNDTSVGQTGDATHSYAVAGTHRVSITGDFPRIYFNDAGDKDKIISIEQWGNIAWSSMESAFAGCTNLRYNATDRPDLSRVTSTAGMFRNAVVFNGNIGLWDVSQVTDMAGMFNNASSFNQNLNLWDVSQVTDMAGMFSDATEFNGDISGWEVGQVTDMNNMFNNATSFNQGIGNWNVSQVADMEDMFVNVTLSTENYDALLSGWSTIDDDESSLRSTVNFNAGSSRYCNQAAKNILTGTYSWMITDGNRDTDGNCLIPELANEIADQDIFAGTEFNYTFPEDTFHSPRNDTLIYTVNVSPSAEWLNFSSEARTFSGIPSADDIGVIITITVTATDANGNSAEDIFTLTTVLNQPPVVAAGLVNQRAVINTPFSYSIDGTFNDPDGGRLSYTETGRPEWLSFSTINNTFSGTPTSTNDIGISTVTVTATDQLNSSASGTFTITVPNRPPVTMAGLTSQTATVGNLFEYPIPDGTFSDPDGGPLSYTATGRPEWLSFSTINNTFSGTPTRTNDIGISTITVTVTDLNDGSLVSTFTITVLNQLPVVATGLVNQNAVINIPFSYSIDGTFNDPDGGPLSYTATGRPEWLDFSTINNTFSGTPTSTNDIGISTITVTVTDLNDGSLVSTFTVTVLNQPPVVAEGLTSQRATVGNLFEYPIPDGAFSDPDGGLLSYTATGRPRWLDFSTINSTFSGTPGNTDDVGISTITVTVTDLNGGSLISTFTITVPNQPPIVAAGLVNQRAVINTPFSYSIDGTFSDPDRGTLSYTATGRPGWLDFSTINNTFSGTPTSTNDIGISTITVTVADNLGAISTDNFTLTVVQVNMPTTLTMVLENRTAYVGELFMYDIEGFFSDPDSGPLSYTVAGQPDWLNFSTETRIFSGTPSSTDDIGISTVTITATDQFNSSASGTFTITVPNRPPVTMAGLTSQTATVGNLFEYPIPDGTFSDPDGGLLSYTAKGKPGWLDFSTINNTFSGTPGNTDDVGISTITVTVTDLNGGSLISTFTVTVLNQPPVVAAGLVNQSAIISIPFSYSIDGTFSDPDRGTLSYTATGRPRWLDFSTINNTFSGTPTSTNDIGISTITVTVADHLSAISTDNFTLTVVQVNMPTTLTMALENHTAYVGELFMYDIEGFFSDPDGGPLSYTVTGQPGWLDFSTINNTFSGTPTSTNDIGISTVTVTATDQLNSSASGTFTITVPNRPPVVEAGLTSQTATVGNLFEYPIPDGAFSDPDGGSLSYTATGQPGWLDFSTINNTFSGTPDSTGDIGVSTITVTVTDLNGGNLVSTFTVTVPNRPPVVAAGLTPQTATVGNLFEYPIPDGAFSDPDGGLLSYTATGQPRWLDFSTINNTFSGTPTSTNDIGISTITVTVTDLNDGSLVSTFTVTVTNPFITIWRTTADNESITIPTHSESTYNYTVNWGDNDTSVGQTGDATHSYAVAGDYRVSITGDFPRIYFNGVGGSRNKIISIEQWGNIAWNSMESAFEGCANLLYNATDTPDLSGVTSTVEMFREAAVFNGDIGLWDVSMVTDMSGMFFAANEFNGDISEWDVSQVTDMSSMFFAAIAFNQNLNAWNVGQVTDMSDMFFAAIAFNQNLNLWNVSSVTDMSRMFFGAAEFNGDISPWDVSQVAKMEEMFANVTLSTENYDALLSGWSTIDDDESSLQPDVNFHAGNSQYCNQAAKNILTGTYSWMITDGNRDTDGNCLIPELANEIADQDIFAGTEFSYTFSEDTFNSPSNSSLTYTVNQSPPAAWLNFNAETRTFSGTPAATDIGVVTITVTATDANGNSAEDIFTLTTVLNQPPVVAAGLVNQRAVINTPFSYSIDGTFNDPDGGRLSYTATGRPEWLNFSTISNTFSGTPTSTNDIGISTVTVTATDQFNSSASDTFTITVPNRPPVVTAGLTSQRATVGNLFEYSIPDGTFSDPDGGRLSYTATGRPEWLSFSTINNTFSGTPGSTNDIGISTITVTVTDLNGGSLVSTFTVTVTNPFITIWRTTADNESITIPTHSESIYNYTVDWGDSNTSVEQTGDATHRYAVAGDYSVSITGDFPRIYFNGAGDNEKIISIEQWGNIAWRSMESAFEGCTNLGYNAADRPDLSDVTSTAEMFRNADIFNGNIGLWDVSQVTDMSGLFDSAVSFNRDLNGWDVGQVTDMSGMFDTADSFDQDLPDWDVSKVTDMSGMFSDAAEFNGDISGWNVGQVTDMSGMFDAAAFFNQNLNWDVSQVTDMSGMFLEAVEFNGDISGWDVSQVTDMSNMFLFATEFNSDISEWNVGRVTDMSSMFDSAESFNQNLNLWNVSSVTDMSGMFLFAISFNQDLTDWDVSKVTDMSSMFFGADEFNGDISQWDVSQVAAMEDMFFDVTLSTENYDALLSGWSTIDDDESSLLSTVNFHAGSSRYCNRAARNILIGTYSWMITDDGQDTDRNCLIPFVANEIADQDILAGPEFSYTFSEDTFSSPSNSSLTYTVNQFPPAQWLNFNAETRTFFGTPSADDIGEITITVTATDSNGNSAEDIFTLTTALNQPPVVAAGLVNQRAVINTPFSYSIDGTFSDPDGGRLSYTATGRPEWLSFSTINNTFSGTPTSTNDIGISTITVTVTDQLNSSASDTFTITVPNRPPVVEEGLLDQSAVINTPFSYSIDGTFSDPDGGLLRYMPSGQPIWLNFSTISNTFSGTPSNTDISISTITVTVADHLGAISTDNFTLTVVQVNTPPTLTMALEDQTAYVGMQLIYNIGNAFSDPDDGQLSYTASGQPSWLSFSTRTGIFSGTPPNTDDIGISTVTVTATDQFNSSASDTFTITVPNRPPIVMAGLTSRTATVGNLFEYPIPDAAFRDPDGGSLSYTATGQPGWLNFSTRTGIFSGTPSSTDDIGISTVTVTATDQFNSSASNTFTITVPNRPPVVMAGLTPQTATFGNLFEYPIPDGVFSDPDGGSLSYTATGQPRWLDFSTMDNTFSGTPSSTNDIGISTIAVMVTDLNGGSLVSTFTVTVTNRPPVVAAGLTSQTAMFDKLFEYPIPDGAFSDPDGGSLSYTAAGQPEWLSFSTINNTFSGTPTRTDHIGISTITVTVTDLNDGNLVSTFTITVPNRPPVVAAGLTSQTATVGNLFEYRISDAAFRDPDGGSLSYTATRQLGWLNFSTRTGIFSGTPGSTDDIGISTITVTVTDLNGGSLISTFTLTVPNRPPVIAAGLTPQTATVGNLFEYPIPDGTFSDPDGGLLSYTATGQPGWLNFSTTNNTFSGTPGSTDDIGVSTITVTVTDLNDGILVSTFTVTVLNQPPVIAAGLVNQSAVINTAFSYPIDGTFSDPDGGRLSYTTTGQPGWLDFSTRTRIFSGTPGSTNDIGVSTITVTVADHLGAISTDKFTLTVVQVNMPTTLTMALEDRTAYVGELFMYAIEGFFRDPDGGPLSYQSKGQPGWLNFSTRTRIFSGTPSSTDDIGISTVTVTATDQFNSSASDTFTITVPNRPPVVTAGLTSQIATVGNLFEYPIPDAAFSDPDDGQLSYTVAGQPGWLNFSTRTGIFSGTPSSTDDIGISTVTVTATDQFNSSASDTFTITVLNRPPVVAAGLTPQIATVGNLFEYRIPDAAFSDPDGGSLSYTATGQPSWLNFSTETRIFSGTPGSTNDIGISTITVTVTDPNGGSLVSTFTVTVTNPFITIWRTTADNESITIPTHSESIYNYTVDWGDSSTSVGQTGDATHSYAVAGDYSVSITGDFPRIYFNDAGDSRNNIISIEQWGNIAWSSMESAFEGCANLLYNAADIPDLSSVTSTAEMFRKADFFNGDIGLWDVSMVTDMSGMFDSAASFDQDLTDWDVSQVTDMSGMFSEAAEFNGDISGWEVGQVTDMSSMFDSATFFNQDLTDWDVSQVTDMSGMFLEAEEFNGDISEWEVGQVTDMSNMFLFATEFNSDISEWEVGQVTDMSDMFDSAESFNQDLNEWDVSAVTDMSGMFFLAFSFNQDLNDWDVSAVTDMSNMFYDAEEFNGDISQWKVGQVTDMSGMFFSAISFNQDLNLWDVSAVTDMSNMFFGAAEFNGDISQWDVSQVADMEDMFFDVTLSTENYDALLSGWSTIDDDESSLRSTVNFNAGSSRYCNRAARNILTGTYSWMITDGNRDTAGNCLIPFVANEIADQDIFVGTEFIYTFPEDTFNSPSNSSLIYTVNKSPSAAWLNFDADTRTLSGTPSAGDIGVITITVTATDSNGNSVKDTFTLTIVPNQPPVVEEGLAPQTATVGNLFEYPIPDGAFSDPDGGRLSYTATGQPGWLDFSTINNTFSGTPTSTNDIGVSTITVTVTDLNGGSLISTFTVTVTNPFITIWRTTADNESITIPTHSESIYNYTVDWGDNDTSVGQTGDATHRYAVAGDYRVSITGDFPRIYFNGAGDSRNNIISIEQWGNIAWSSMESAFAGCTNLRYDAVDRPDLSNVTSTAEMFRVAAVFNGNIGLWDVSMVTDMSDMFDSAESFNQDLNEWDVSAVTDMSGMFFLAFSFNQDLNDWDVSAVTDMSNMFYDAEEFNGDISQWEVGQVTDMSGMFFSAISFNQNLKLWDVSAVTDMSNMFFGADEFNGDISQWDVSQVADMEDMFFDVTLSTENYDALLSGWSTIDDDESSLRSTVNFNAGSSRYCNRAARNILTGTYSWMITDGNRDTAGNCLIPFVANEIADQDILVGTEFSYTLEDTFSSPSNSSLTYTVNQSPPAAWLNFDADTLTFSGTPSAENIGMTITITVTATDSNGNSAEDTFTLTVNNPALKIKMKIKVFLEGAQ